MSLTISKKTKSAPTLPYEAMQKSILGKSYDLSLVFVGARRAQALNKKHRQKTYVPNILSFPLTKHGGEIYITPTVAKKQAKRYGMTVTGYTGYLFIHGLLHLKGYAHGATMEGAEKKYIAQYRLK